MWHLVATCLVLSHIFSLVFYKFHIFYDIIGDNSLVLIIRRKCSASRSYERVNLNILTHSLYLELRDVEYVCACMCGGAYL